MRVWRDRGHTEATIAVHLNRSHCLGLGTDEIGRLTRQSVDRFARAYARRRGRGVDKCVEAARSSLHAWARAATVVGPAHTVTTMPSRTRVFPSGRAGLHPHKVISG